MANYKMRIDEKTGITYIEVTGTLVLEDSLRYMNSDTYKSRTSRLVSDVRQASLEGMSRGAIAKMVRTVKKLGKPGIRAAYIFNRGEDFNKGKTLLAQIEVLGFEGEFRIFTELEDAVDWVKK